MNVATPKNILQATVSEEGSGNSGNNHKSASRNDGAASAVTGS